MIRQDCVKSIYIDVDGVLFQYGRRFHHWMLENHPKVEYDKNANFPAQYVTWFQETELFGMLPVVSGAQKAIKEISKMDVNYRLMTKSVENDIQKYYRMTGLIKHFPLSILLDAIYIPYWQSKSCWLYENTAYGYREDHLLIDDNPTYCSEWRQAGGKAIHLQGEWPKDAAIDLLDGIETYNDWDSVLVEITEWLND